MPIDTKSKLESAWVTEKVCPACRHATFGVLDETYALIQLESSEQNKTSIQSDENGNLRFYPLVVAMCAKCGYTMLFNARQLGVIQLTEE